MQQHDVKLISCKTRCNIDLSHYFFIHTKSVRKFLDNIKDILGNICVRRIGQALFCMFGQTRLEKINFLIGGKMCLKYFEPATLHLKKNIGSKGNRFIDMGGCIDISIYS